MSEFVVFLASGLALGCSFALVASGMVTIHRVTRVVNLAQGTFAVVAALCASSLLTAGLPHGLAEVVAVLVAGLVGLLFGVVAIGRRGTPVLISLVVTLGLAVGAYAVEIAIWGDQPRSFPGVPGTFGLLGARIQYQYVLVAAVTAATLGALALFFGRSYLGKGLTACADNPRAAAVVGIDVRRMGLVAFALGGLLGGVAGVLITPLQQVAFNSDIGLALNGFAAAVFGGLTRPMLALAGGLMLGVVSSMVGGYVGASYATEVALVMVLALMVWQARHRTALGEAA